MWDHPYCPVELLLVLFHFHAVFHCVNIHHILLIHSGVEGPLGSLQFGTIANMAAVSCLMRVFWGPYLHIPPGRGLQGLRTLGFNIFYQSFPKLQQFFVLGFCFVLFFSFGCATWHVGYLFPDRGSNLRPLQWKCGALTTGPPGQSLTAVFEQQVKSGPC